MSAEQSDRHPSKLPWKAAPPLDGAGAEEVLVAESTLVGK
jgi:hypothetical protein